MKASNGSDSSLPPVWVIGFTGHRRLPHPDKVSQSLRNVINSLSTEIRGQLMGYSSAAIGADTLFAEICIALNIPWTALLPRPEDDFRTDFNESDWKKTLVLLQRAARVEALPATRDRDIAYLECGLSTVEESDLMIAVWDGELSRGLGGTADVVAHARTLSKPLILVDSNTLDIRRERFSPELFSDAEMIYLNQLPDHSAPADPSSSSAQECVRRFFLKVDARAARIAPRFRRWVGASVVMNGLAAILTAASVAFAISSRPFDALIFILVAAATVSVILIKRKAAHRKWIRCRIAAEICRSALATWNFGDLATSFWFAQLEGFTRLAKSVRLLHLNDRRTEPIDVQNWRDSYLKFRVDDQIVYFRQRRREIRVALVTLTVAFWVFSGAAIARSVYSIAHTQIPSLLYWRPLDWFLSIGLPLTSGCVLSLISIFDLNRQLARFSTMETMLTRIRDQVKNCDNLSTLRHAIERAENEFAREVFEWFTLYKYPRFS